MVEMFLRVCVFYLGFLGLCVASSSLFEADKSRLLDGENLIYAIFGDSETLAQGIHNFLGAQLQLSRPLTPSCINSVKMDGSQAVSSLEALQLSPSNINTDECLVVAFEEVEYLSTRQELTHLDFIFRLPNKDVEMSNIVALLVFNTDHINQSESESPFWWKNLRTRQREWREGLRTLWNAAGPEFNVDAAIGRIHRAVFLDPIPTTTTTTTKDDDDRNKDTIIDNISICESIRNIEKRENKNVFDMILTFIKESLSTIITDSGSASVNANTNTGNGNGNGLFNWRLNHAIKTIAVANVIFFGSLFSSRKYI
jgi:hypothetical protein